MPKDLSGAQVGMSPRAGVNDPRPNNARGRNVFPQTHMHLTTDRYGEYSPFFWCKAERGDVQNLKTDHDLHTFTMKSPMVGNIEMTKSFIKVPMQAIYPINWEKMLTIPTQGDDVPFDCKALLDVYKLVSNLAESLSRSVGNDNVRFIKSLVLLEALTSHGSLFERFNMHFNYKFVIDPAGEARLIEPDSYFDEVYASLCSWFKDNSYSIAIDDIVYSSNELSDHRIIEILRSNDWQPQYWEDDSSIDDYIGIHSSIIIHSGYKTPLGADSNDYLINIEPIISYQLACAQFGTNDFVDFVYSADLYRQNMLSLIYTFGSPAFFSYNGLSILYDVFSKKYFDYAINEIATYDALDYFINLFSYALSLKFGDYFMGAKPRPLAVGEYSARVVDNSVSAIDMTRNIQMQRLLNQANMVGRKIGDYLAGIYGGQLPEAPKDVPIFLAHQSFSIGGFETENTGEVQFNPNVSNTITSHLRSSENRHSFEIEISEPCYILGINSYTMRPIYSRGIDRFAFHHDRYDDFIPQMQYIGDQDIKLVELDSSRSEVLTPYAYTLRYMEYKQRPSYASGGFVNNLPSWAFIADNDDGNIPSSFISPDYIRSSPSEFDRFYKSLTGYSLGNYFHFIVAHTNVTNPVRQMEYAPEILK